MRNVLRAEESRGEQKAAVVGRYIQTGQDFMDGHAAAEKRTFNSKSVLCRLNTLRFTVRVPANSSSTFQVCMSHGHPFFFFFINLSMPIST